MAGRRARDGAKLVSGDGGILAIIDRSVGAADERNSKGRLHQNSEQADWNKSRIASGDLAEKMALLKQEAGKDILVHGGAAFAQSLAKLGLIDTYHLIVHPVILSGGLALFKEAMNLELLSAKTFPAGTVALTYGGV